MPRLRTAVFAPIGVLVLLATFAVPTLVDAKANRERFEGKLTDGTATALDSNAPSACGGSWKGFLALHRAGKTYINVHTNDGVASTNTGPGDFPQGELRGQMLPRD